MKQLVLVLSIAALMGMVFSCTPTSTAESTITLKVASDTTFPPMEFIDENANITGFDIDLIKAVAEAAGAKVEVKTTAWDGIFAGLDNGSYDLIASSVTITDERKEKFDFSEPYVTVGQVVVVPVGDESTTGLAGLEGKRIGVQQGTTGDLTAQGVAGATVSAYPEIGLAFQDLINGNIDGIIIDSPVAADYAMRNIDIKGKCKIVGELLTSEPYGFVVKKDNAKVKDLLDKGIAALKANGKLEEIKAAWGLK